MTLTYNYSHNKGFFAICGVHVHSNDTEAHKLQNDLVLLPHVNHNSFRQLWLHLNHHGMYLSLLVYCSVLSYVNAIMTPGSLELNIDDCWACFFHHQTPSCITITTLQLAERANQTYKSTLKQSHQWHLDTESSFKVEATNFQLNFTSDEEESLVNAASVIFHCLMN